MTLYKLNHTKTNNRGIEYEKKLQAKGKFWIKLKEGEISFNEATSVVKNMAYNKCPGSDWFTKEFFKGFFLE